MRGDLHDSVPTGSYPGKDEQETEAVAKAKGFGSAAIQQTLKLRSGIVDGSIPFSLEMR